MTERKHRLEVSQSEAASAPNEELGTCECQCCVIIGGSHLPRSPLQWSATNEVDSRPSTMSCLSGSVSQSANSRWRNMVQASRRRKRCATLSPAMLLSVLMMLGTLPMSQGQVLLPPGVPPSPTLAIPQEPTSPQETPVVSTTNSPAIQPAAVPATGSPLTTNATSRPTTHPTITRSPTVPPTTNPTGKPTITPYPTSKPSAVPSDFPSSYPSNGPTVEPTLSQESSTQALFRQKFTVNNGRTFSLLEVELLQELYESYTIDFEDLSEPFPRINTTCVVVAQVGFTRRRFLRGEEAVEIDLFDEDHNSLQRSLQAFSFTEVDYMMFYSSKYTNITDYPSLFQRYVNDNLSLVTLQLNDLGLNITETSAANRFFAPAQTILPTSSPSLLPSLSNVSSDNPSLSPTSHPTYSPSPTMLPVPLSTLSPTRPPSARSDNEGLSNTSIVILVIVVGLVVLIGLIVYYRRRRKLLDRDFPTNIATNVEKADTDNMQARDGGWGEAVRKSASYNNASSAQLGNMRDKTPYTNKGTDIAVAGGVGSPSESLVSTQSLLSAGNCMAGDSGDEADTTQNLADEFDQYKDQNLEKMRVDVEGNLTGFDGMMSQALTKALIDDDEAIEDPTDYQWGDATNGLEIEASALFEVVDWLKRNDQPSYDEKRGFMQETLNRMVASVRHGILGPDDASRSIHECAALLGLQLATEIPVSTLIVSGMRKTATSEQMIRAFVEFGEILEAAVAANRRGFGILRFRSNNSVERAMQKFRTSEIVVQDVAVQVKVLEAGGQHSASNQASQ